MMKSPSVSGILFLHFIKKSSFLLKFNLTEIINLIKIKYTFKAISFVLFQAACLFMKQISIVISKPENPYLHDQKSILRKPE